MKIILLTKNSAGGSFGKKFFSQPFSFYLFHNFFISLVLILFLIFGLKGRGGERRYKVPEDVVEGGGLDDIAQQPVESLGRVEERTHMDI